MEALSLLPLVVVTLPASDANEAESDVWVSVRIYSDPLGVATTGLAALIAVEDDGGAATLVAYV